MLCCVSSISYSFLINREQLGSITPSRGIKLGDPLSPFLFLICVKPLLLCWMLNYKNRGFIQGVQIVISAPSITHLMFADDYLFLFKATTSSCQAL